MTPTPATVAVRPRAVLHADPVGAGAVEPRGAYSPLPDEMPDADGSAFLLTYLPAPLLWSDAVSAWLREDDGQPLRITRGEILRERRDRKRRERAAGVRSRTAGAERARAPAARPAPHTPR